MRLDNDMGRAIAKLADISALRADLPGKDCGVCGAPTCDAFAEDIVCPDETSSRWIAEVPGPVCSFATATFVPSGDRDGGLLAMPVAMTVMAFEPSMFATLTP